MFRPSLVMAARTLPAWSVCQPTTLPGFCATSSAAPVRTLTR
ncbi:Uncharacterised protein [Bordetella pertussis]|nr:Uncharacterised protein [Bordetella pertussis]